MYRIQEFRANLREVLDKAVQEPQYIKRGKKVWELLYCSNGNNEPILGQKQELPKSGFWRTAVEGLSGAKTTHECGCKVKDSKLCSKHGRY